MHSHPSPAASSDIRQFAWVRDPRDAGRCVGAYFTISAYGTEPHGYGEHFDPGSGPEFDLVAFIDDDERHIDLADADAERVEAAILEMFDFRAAERDERHRDAELTLCEGVL